MRIKKYIILNALIAFAVGASNSQTRTVEKQTLISTELPKIAITVDPAFKYIGKFDFVLKEIAKGERYVFVDADRGKKIKRLFIAQFEGFIPGNSHTYNYRFDNAELMAGHKFRQNTFAYSNLESERDAPAAEAALTAKFLRDRGYKLEDELMMSRFLTVPDAERRNELILFYLENASTTGKNIADFYADDEETTVWKNISVGLTARSREAFKVSSIP